MKKGRVSVSLPLHAALHFTWQERKFIPHRCGMDSAYSFAQMNPGELHRSTFPESPEITWNHQLKRHRKRGRNLECSKCVFLICSAPLAKPKFTQALENCSGSPRTTPQDNTGGCQAWMIQEPARLTECRLPALQKVRQERLYGSHWFFIFFSLKLLLNLAWSLSSVSYISHSFLYLDAHLLPIIRSLKGERWETVTWNFDEHLAVKGAKVQCRRCNWMEYKPK